MHSVHNYCGFVDLIADPEQLYPQREPMDSAQASTETKHAGLPEPPSESSSPAIKQR